MSVTNLSQARRAILIALAWLAHASMALSSPPPSSPVAPPRGLSPRVAAPAVPPLPGVAFDAFADVQVNVDPGNLYDDYGPAVAISPAGVIHVVWTGDETQKTVWYARSTDAGQTFSPAVRLNDAVAYPPSYSVYQPDVALGPDGSVYVAWFDYRAWTGDADFTSRIDTYVDRSTDGGLTWGTDVLASPGGSGTYPWHFAPHLAVDPQAGTIYVSFNDYDRYLPQGDPGDVSVSRSTDGGLSFESKVRADDLGDSVLAAQGFSSVAVSPGGAVIVAFEDSRGAGRDIRVAVSTDGGLSFGPSLPVLADTTGVQQQPSLAAGPFGDVAVVWLDWSLDPDPTTAPFENHIRCARAAAAGAPFGPATLVTDVAMNGDFGFDFPPRVAIDRLGLLHVVWHDRRSGSSQCYVDRSADGGLSFGADAVLSSNTDPVTHALPRLAMGGDDDPGVVWMDRRHGNGRFDVFFARRQALTAAPEPRPGAAGLAAAPNPFGSATVVRFTTAAPGAAELEVRDLQGRRVRRLLAGDLSAGAHAARWDGRDDAGRWLAPGVYWLRLETAGGVAGRKVTRLPNR
jgi:hypothetical protein